LGKGGTTYTAAVAERMDYAVFMALLMVQFFTGMFALFFCIRFLHQRRMITTISPERRFRWKNFLYGVGITVGILIVSDFISYGLDPGSFHWQFQPQKFLPLLAVSLLVFPVQTGFEELLFRGYILPAVSYHSRNVWVGLLVSSLLFGLLHLANSEVSEYGIWEMLPVYCGTGLVFGLVALLSEGTEMGWGIHLVNNLYVVLVKTFPGSSLESPALFRTDAPTTGSIIRETAILLVLLLMLVWLRYRREPVRKLLG
jgi:membrane protease YdiL (CAAX protease family)